MSLCPCGSNIDQEKCCGRYLAGEKVPTAEALMRSRYTAYVQGNIDYIEKTCAPESLVDFDRQETSEIIQNTKWQGLEIRRIEAGGPKDETGIVEFVFRFNYNNEPQVQHEIANFCRIDGAWRYKDSEINPKEPPVRVAQIGRNDPCSCGSGKKYKKCCGGH